MADFHIHPSKLQGSVTIPPSKSHTLRAILFAAFAKGTSEISHFLASPDTHAMIQAVQMLGAHVIESEVLKIKGFEGNPKTPDDVIDCGNSGILLRFFSAIAALLPHHTILTGDASIRHNRPMQPLLSALNQLGAYAVSSRGDGMAPVIIQGPLTKQRAALDGSDSQFVSALLIAGAFAPHPIELVVTNPGEKPWVDLTLDWLQRLGIQVHAENHTYYRLEGNSKIDAFSYSVPGDFSSAAFPIAAALLTDSVLTLRNVDMTDVQGDKALISILEQMGARFSIEQTSLTVEKGALNGAKIDVNQCIDALPILAVIATQANGPTELFNGAVARTKECDRIAAVAKELRKMGALIEERPDGLVIHPSRLQGADLESHQDHRLALSLSVAALTASSPSRIRGVECMTKTYATFQTDFQALGAIIQ